MLKDKKTAFWVIGSAAAVCAAAALCFLINTAGDAVRNPSVQEYTPGQGNKGVDADSFRQISEDFAIGADENGIAVFKDPEKAFETFQALYADGISWIREENDLPPFSEKTYQLYKTYGWQMTTGTEKQKEQAVFIAKFLDIYENSFATEQNLNVAEPTAGAPLLSLDDVLLLSQKGENLNWGDFDGFSYTAPGSGLYIRFYEINPLFSLWIGGSLEDKPMYIYLRANAADDFIDIRTEDVAAFIREHQEDDLLDAAISKAILEHNKGAYPGGDFACESHVILGTLEGKRRDEKSDAFIQTVEVYLMALYQEYGYAGAGFRNTGGSHVPCVLTFDLLDSGAYELTEYWEPRDGSYYAPDIKKRFKRLSSQAVSDALDTQKFILAQIQCCYAQAVEHGNVATGYIVSELFDKILSSPAESSNPEDYMDVHPIEYRELTYFGDYTLRYIFSEFLKGGQVGLKGQLMRIVMDDLINGEAIVSAADTGQDYFDEWLSAARQTAAAKGSDYMQKNAPKSWLLLQMTAEG